MEGFRINLKTFFGLAMPNQYCLTVIKLVLGNNWGQNPYPCDSFIYPLTLMRTTVTDSSVWYLHFYTNYEFINLNVIIKFCIAAHIHFTLQNG